MKSPFHNTLAAFVFCAAPAFAQDTVIDAGTVLARVGDTEITLGHMIAMRAVLPAEYQNLPDAMLLDSILEQVVRQQVVANIAEENISPLTQHVLDNERRAVLATTLLDDIANAAITQDALQAEYDAIYANTTPVEEVNAAHILVETEEEALGLLVEIEAGADFADLARQYSTGPSGANGGALGWFSQGMMVAPFEQAAFGLDLGQVSSPVETQFGWHLIMLNDRRERPTPTLDDVRPNLSEGLQRAAVDAQVDEWLQNADIERMTLDIDPSLIRDIDLLNDD